MGVAGININYTDNEKLYHNYWKLTEKVSTATLLFSHGFDLSALCGKKKNYGNNKFLFIPNCLIVFHVKVDQNKLNAKTADNGNVGWLKA